MDHSRSHIIAEAGVNHNGKISYAKKLVEIASNCGADSVKFQIINPYGLYLPGDYNYGHYDIQEVIKNRFSTVLSDDQYNAINRYCIDKDISFSGSVFDLVGLELLSGFNPPYIKIASSDLTNVRLLRKVAEKGIKMILSTGMSTLKEIEFSLNALSQKNFDDIVLLHCVSVYPCPIDKTNIAFIKTLQDTFGLEVGFSDHTRTTEASVAAYSYGSRWFEKHFTFDNNLEGFDHKHAQSEEEFKYYVNTIRAIEASLNPDKEKITGAEKYTSQRARRSLYAAHTLKAGHILSDSDVLCVRPSAKMIANQIDQLIGKPLVKDINQYDAFSLSDVET